MHSLENHDSMVQRVVYGAFSAKIDICLPGYLHVPDTTQMRSSGQLKWPATASRNCAMLLDQPLIRNISACLRFEQIEHGRYAKILLHRLHSRWTERRVAPTIADAKSSVWPYINLLAAYGEVT